MKTLLLSVVALWMTGIVHAIDFDNQLSANTAELKAAAVETPVTVIPARVVFEKALYQSNDPWWRGAYAQRVRDRFSELTNASYQFSTSQGLFSGLEARSRVCKALKAISWEGTVDPSNINGVIDWMNHDVDGLIWQLNNIRMNVGTWALMGPLAPCISEHSRYLSDRIRAVTGH